MSPDEIEKWYIARYYNIGRLNAGIHNILDETSHLEHPTPELAEIAFDITYFQERAKEVHLSLIKTITEL